MLDDEIDFNELMVEWLSMPVSLEHNNHVNVRLQTSSDHSILEVLCGPAMHKRRLRAIIHPKNGDYPRLLVVKMDEYQRYSVVTEDGSSPPFPSLVGFWSSAKLCQQHYDKLLRQIAIA